MSKKFGALGLMLTAGLLFVHPSVGEAQQRYGNGNYYSYNDRDYRRDNDRGHNRDFRQYEPQKSRQERDDRKWRAKERREHERWEQRNYYNGRGKYGNPSYGYHDSYRPY
jgi:hypothetical protein